MRLGYSQFGQYTTQMSLFGSRDKSRSNSSTVLSRLRKHEEAATAVFSEAATEGSKSYTRYDAG